MASSNATTQRFHAIPTRCFTAAEMLQGYRNTDDDIDLSVRLDLSGPTMVELADYLLGAFADGVIDIGENNFVDLHTALTSGAWNGSAMCSLCIAVYRIHREAVLDALIAFADKGCFNDVHKVI